MKVRAPLVQFLGSLLLENRSEVGKAAETSRIPVVLYGRRGTEANGWVQKFTIAHRIVLRERPASKRSLAQNPCSNTLHLGPRRPTHGDRPLSFAFHSVRLARGKTSRLWLGQEPEAL